MKSSVVSGMSLSYHKFNIAYPRVLDIRKNYGPQFQKHVSTKACGWDHLECVTCQVLDRKVLD